jgi:hypothetical protein
MKKAIKTLVLVLPFFLAACAPEVLLSDANSVVVNASLKSPEEAKTIADRECAKYNKVSYLMQKAVKNNTSANYLYECITP